MNREVFFAQQCARLFRRAESDRVDVELSEQHHRDFLVSELSRGVFAVRARELFASYVVGRLQIAEAEARAVRDLCSEKAACEAAIVFQSDAVTGGSERFGRLCVIEEEKAERGKIAHLFRVARSRHRAHDLIAEEFVWRRSVAAEASLFFRRCWTDHAAKNIEWIQSSNFLLGEPRLRQFVVVHEAHARRRLAVHFCSIRLLWDEDWSRRRIALEARTLFGFLSVAGLRMQREAVEREHLRLTFAPIAARFRVELHRRASCESSRLNELQRLRDLRRRELQRIEQLERDRQGFVLKWRIDALGRIMETHDALLQDAARFAEDPSCLQRVREGYAAAEERLSQPGVPFAELLRYRESLIPTTTNAQNLQPHVADRVRLMTTSSALQQR